MLRIAHILKILWQFKCRLREFCITPVCSLAIIELEYGTNHMVNLKLNGAYCNISQYLLGSIAYYRLLLLSAIQLM